MPASGSEVPVVEKIKIHNSNRSNRGHYKSLPADGKLKTVQDGAIEVFLSWIKWAVMSRILPEGSSDFFFGGGSLCLAVAARSFFPRFSVFLIFFGQMLFEF